MIHYFTPKIKKPVIIGIHGLSNKPPKKKLNLWWKQSLAEGLKKYNIGIEEFHFDLVYWADLLYPEPLDPKEKNEKSHLYIEDPYIPSHETLIPKKKGFWKNILRQLNNFKENLFLSKNGLVNYSFLFDFLLKKLFMDLDAYYNHSLSAEELMNDEPIRKKIRDRLRHTIKQHKNEKILLIAHSMGSIIAYDVLYMMAKEEGIHTFITLGSPLGLPMIRKKFFEEHQLSFNTESKYNTPDSIQRWYNFADDDDSITVYRGLQKEFLPNKDNLIPQDFVVHNNYKDWHTTNAHKSYGYLRTPEIAKVITEFLIVEKVTSFHRITKWFKKLLKRNVQK